MKPSCLLLPAMMALVPALAGHRLTLDPTLALILLAALKAGAATTARRRCQMALVTRSRIPGRRTEFLRGRIARAADGRGPAGR